MNGLQDKIKNYGAKMKTATPEQVAAAQYRAASQSAQNLPGTLGRAGLAQAGVGTARDSLHTGPTQSASTYTGGGGQPPPNGLPPPPPPPVVDSGAGDGAAAPPPAPGGSGSGAAAGGTDLGSAAANNLNAVNMQAMRQAMQGIQSQQALGARRANEMAATRGGSAFGGMQQAGAAQAQLGANQMYGDLQNQALQRTLGLGQWGTEREDNIRRDRENKTHDIRLARLQYG